jgi:hypothetical protein
MDFDQLRASIAELQRWCGPLDECDGPRSIRDQGVTA